jgi:hypothetical protein
MPFIPFGALTSFTTTWGWRRTIACRVCRTWVVRACGVLSRPLGLTLTTTLSLNERQIIKQLRGALGNHPALLGRHVPLARQMLRTSLDGNILCEPIEEDHRPGYRFTATGTFGRLLTGTSVRLRVKRIEKEAERSRFLSAGTSSIRRKRARGSTKGWFGGGEGS